MRELQPVNQNVLLEFADENKEQKTASGIIIPDSAKEKEKVARIVAISNIENPEFAVGDDVLYKAFSGSEVSFEGKKFLLVPYGDILAKVVNTEEI